MIRPRHLLTLFAAIAFLASCGPSKEDTGKKTAGIEKKLVAAEEALEEARRCMSCGQCFDCETCWMYCQNSGFEKLPKGQHFRVKLEVCIQDAAPDIVWVGLGAPREEYWMANQLRRGSKTVMVGMGLACDAGRVPITRWVSLCRTWQLSRRTARGAPTMDLDDRRRAPGLRGWNVAMGDGTPDVGSGGGGR